jgi:hypothetical protein
MRGRARGHGLNLDVDLDMDVDVDVDTDRDMDTVTPTDTNMDTDTDMNLYITSFREITKALTVPPKLPVALSLKSLKRYEISSAFKPKALKRHKEGKG